MNVVVAGGGVIGCSIAFHLQKGGAKVTLIERGVIGGEASSAAAGMLIAPIEDAGNRAFDDLRRASLDMYPALLEEIQRLSGIDVQYNVPGMLRTARSVGMARRLKALSQRQTGLEWVEGSVLRSLEPGLNSALLGAAYAEGDAEVNPGFLTKALAESARKLGARVLDQTMLTGFPGRGARVTEVSTDAGDVVADAIVLAAGPWTELLSMRLGRRLPTPPMRGQMLAYRSRAVHHAVWGEDGYLVPKPRGLIFAGATVEDVGFRNATTARALKGLERMAAALVPALARATVVSTWAGLRPGSPDGLPLIGRFPGKENVYVASGHFRNGILLAPVTGRLVCDLVLSGKPDRRLRPFAPGRFSAAR
jgi:glycine oxidase